MSLQVWLPLNGTMENQGLLNLTPTQQGTISWINGKIGKCLSAGTETQTANGISYNSNLIDELGSEFSATIWVKPLGNHVHYNGTFVSSGNWNGKKWAFGVSQNNSQVDVFCQGCNSYLTCAVPVNEWTHLVCVHKGTTVKLYKNGVYVGEKTGVPETLDSDASNFCVGRETYAGGYFSFNGNLNDLRIYNHALSIKEIKLIFQGLILHYPLNQKELDLINRDTLTHEKCLKENGTASTSGWCYTDYISVNPNAHYLGIGLSSGGSNTYAVLYDGLKNQTRALLLTANQDLIVDTDDTEQYIRLSIRELNNELNTTAKFIYINPIMYDTSGYCNNGIVTGTLNTSTDTLKYDCSTIFPSGSHYIDAGRGAMVTDTITVNLWCKYSTWGNPISCTEGGGWNFEFTSNSGIRFSIYITGVGYKVANSNISTNTLLNEWHMLTGTYDKTNVKIYIDGELKGTTATNSTNNIGYPSGNVIFIGAEAGSNRIPVSTAFVGNISDVRIYATALSAEDIAELYSVGASIDNQGNIYSAMIQEV